MKMLIQVVLVAVVVGGVSAGGSYFLRPKPVAVVAAGTEANQTAATDPAAPSSTEATHDGVPSESTPTSVSKNSEPVPDVKPLASTTDPEHPGVMAVVPELPVAVRPPYVTDGDEAGLLITALRSRAQAADIAERSLAERQAGLRLIFDDLRTEQTLAAKLRQRVLEELAESKRFVEQTLKVTDGERETLRREHEESRAAAEVALSAAQDELGSLKKQLEALREVQDEQVRAKQQLDVKRKASSTTTNGDGATDTSGSPAEIANLKKLTAVYDSMPPDNVATVCQQLVKKGRLAAVVALLNGMKERQSAKVLTAISDSDPTLAADLSERLKSLKTATTTPAE